MASQYVPTAAAGEAGAAGATSAQVRVRVVRQAFDADFIAADLRRRRTSNSSTSAATAVDSTSASGGTDAIRSSDRDDGANDDQGDEGEQSHTLSLLSGSSVLVGMHPDEPTEAIVDTAIALGKPFAVVPCCVFPRLFPHRQLRTGQGVNTYSGFLQYISEKHHAIQIACLPFEGRNKVLFLRP